MILISHMIVNTLLIATICLPSQRRQTDEYIHHKNPLIISALKNNTKEVKSRVARGANLNTLDSGLSVLSAAIINNNLSLVKYLINHRAKINLRHVDGATPLMLSVGTHTDSNLVKYLLAHGALVNLQTKSERKSALIFAIEKEHNNYVKLLLEAGANPNLPMIHRTYPMQIAVLYRNIVALRLLARYGGNINSQDTDGYTPLLSAITIREPDVVKTLLQLHADPNIKAKPFMNDVFGETPLYAASTNLPVLKLLLAHGAKVNTKSIYGNTPLMKASKFGSLKCVKLMLTYHADPTMRNNKGETALDLANNEQSEHKDEIIELLQTKLDKYYFHKNANKLKK